MFGSDGPGGGSGGPGGGYKVWGMVKMVRPNHPNHPVICPMPTLKDFKRSPLEGPVGWAALWDVLLFQRTGLISIGQS